MLRMMNSSSAGDVFYAFEKVKVRFLKRTPEVEVGGEVLGPFNQNQEVEVDRWIARMLSEEGYAEVIDEKGVDLNALSKIAWKESRNPQLSRLEPTFYVKARHYLQKLAEKASRAPEALTEKKSAEVKLTDIINCRLQKIVHMALVGTQPPREVLENLTPEEKLLLEELSTMISQWRRDIRGENHG
ncbi:MAG: DNA replication complex GINS family protein [Candidatus Nezhaarchaeota archaeon]|nr:DNA replication complex GINS family protein [Candidatus Nezhaarchaeota archaeon]